MTQDKRRSSVEELSKQGGASVYRRLRRLFKRRRWYVVTVILVLVATVTTWFAKPAIEMTVEDWRGVNQDIVASLECEEDVLSKDDRAQELILALTNSARELLPNPVVRIHRERETGHFEVADAAGNEVDFVVDFERQTFTPSSSRRPPSSAMMSHQSSTVTSRGRRSQRWS